MAEPTETDPALIGDREPAVVTASIGRVQVWRPRTGGFTWRQDADAFGTRAQSEHAPCWVVTDTS